MTWQPPGFARAPVTKAMMIVTVISSIACLRAGGPEAASWGGAGGGGGMTTAGLSRMVSEGRWGKLLFAGFTSFAVYPSLGHLLTGMHLTYTFRVLEREMGSAKFGTFLLLVHSLAGGAALALSSRLSTGPLAILGGLLTLFCGHVPSTLPPISVLSSAGRAGAGSGSGEMKVTWDRAFLYMAALYLMGRSSSTAIPAACGGMVALLYASSKGLQRLILPGPIRRLFSILDPLLSSEDPRVVRRREMLEMQRREMARRAMQGGSGRHQQLLRNPAAGGLRQRQPAPVPAPLPVMPSEDSISALMGMGFQREAVVGALREGGGNMEYAANKLLGGS